MLSRLRRFLRSLLEDDWAGAWHAPKRRLVKADDAPVHKAKSGRRSAVASDAEDTEQMERSAVAKDGG